MNVSSLVPGELSQGVVGLCFDVSPECLWEQLADGFGHVLLGQCLLVFPNSVSCAACKVVHAVLHEVVNHFHCVSLH